MTKGDEGGKLDVHQAHKLFSTGCFNKTWELIEKPERTPEEDEEMLHLAISSLWHWTRRDDFAPVNASVGYWQVSRVFALLGQAENALRYGRRSLEVLEGESAPPFFAAYAREAMARAEAVAGNGEEMKGHLEEARRLAGEVNEEENRKILLADLDTISPAN
jgi:hypothetical protein